MTPRNWVKNNLSMADQLYLRSKFRKAYEVYKDIVQYAANPDVKLYAQAQIIICRYHSFAIKAAELLTQIDKFKTRLTDIINSGSYYADMLSSPLTEMQLIEAYINSGINRLLYFKSCASRAIDLANDNNLDKYADLIGLDETNETYQVDYLNDFYNGILKVDRKNSVLLAELTEAMGSIYRELAEKSTAMNLKKQYLMLQVARYEQALMHWRKTKYKSNKTLLLTILQAWEDYYDIAEDGGKDHTLKVVQKITDSDEFKRLPHFVKKEEKENIREDMKDHLDWVIVSLAALNADKGALMLSDSLFVLKDLLEGCEADVDRNGYIEKAVEIIKDVRFENMFLDTNDDNERELRLDKMKEHYLWIQEYVSSDMQDALQNKLERVLMPPPPLNYSVKKRTIDSVDSVSEPEKPYKRQRLGEGIFSSSSNEQSTQVIPVVPTSIGKIVN